MAQDGDLKRQFGAFMRTAVRGLDSVREVVVQKSREGKIQIDVAMLKRKRREALADLGAAVAELAAAGKITEDDFPTLGGPLSALEAIDERIAVEEDRGRRVAAGGDGHQASTGEDEPDDGTDGDPR
jgi:hypothetical protein